MHVLLCTVAAGDGPDFLRGLLDARLVACGNIVQGVRSLYRWKGEIADDAEDLLIMETAAEDIEATIAAIQARHEYEVPKIIALAPDAVLPAYLAWARAQT
jgi:periplasmic divalent cation tolerance protein